MDAPSQGSSLINVGQLGRCRSLHASNACMQWFVSKTVAGPSDKGEQLHVLAHQLWFALSARRGGVYGLVERLPDVIAEQQQQRGDGYPPVEAGHVGRTAACRRGMELFT